MPTQHPLPTGSHRRNGNTYQLEPAEIAAYRENGYLVLRGVLTEAEMAPLDHWFDHFVTGGEPGMGRDFCDMSQPYGTPFEKWQLVNAMLPSKYRSELADNIYHQVAQSIVDQLYTSGKAGLDYEQFLAKRPHQEAAEFAMHQDLGYWPKTENTWTATFSLALTDSAAENGCLQVVPGSNRESTLRSHRPKEAAGDSKSREESHTLVIDAKPTDEIVLLPVRRGDVTVHDERIVHGSGGNTASIWRKTYVAAFRDVRTIAQERAMGFTHSHNDRVDWDKIVR